MHSDRDIHRVLLGPADPAPVECAAGTGGEYFVVCDHASAAIPASLGTLGLSRETLRTHIAIDIGARWAALRIAERLAAPAFIAGYSRLVIDCNRHPADAASIVEESDRTPVPGNLGLPPAARAMRVDEIFRPYHEAIATALEALAAHGARPVFLSIHSCTPQWNDEVRPWQIGVSHHPPDTLSRALLEALRRDPTLIVGDNQPYSLEPEVDYTTPQHALRRGLPYAQIEFRQDLIAARPDALAWADRFVDALLVTTARVSPCTGAGSGGLSGNNTRGKGSS